MIFLCFILGGLLAITMPGHEWLFGFGSIYVNLLKALALPLVVFSIVYSSLKAMRHNEAKRIVLLTGKFYLLTSFLATITGLVFSYLVGLANFEVVKEDVSLGGFDIASVLNNFFPNNIFTALVEGNIVGVITVLILVIYGFSSLENEEKYQIEKFTYKMFKVFEKSLSLIIKLTPIAVFSLVYKFLQGFDLNTLRPLKMFFLASSIALFFHAGITLPLIYWFKLKRSVWSFLFRARKALIIAFTTASSFAALPVTLKILFDEKDVDDEIAGFVVPTGATINMDGSALYQCLIVMTLSVISGIEFNLASLIMLVFLILVASIGTSGTPSGGIVMLTFIMNVVGIPEEYIALYIVVDRVWDYPVTMINVWGDLVVTKCVSKSIST